MKRNKNRERNKQIFTQSANFVERKQIFTREKYKNKE
jgi:hypothetical protein